MNGRPSKIRSVQTYVMTRTVYFDWICKCYGKKSMPDTKEGWLLFTHAILIHSTYFVTSTLSSHYSFSLDKWHGLEGCPFVGLFDNRFKGRGKSPIFIAKTWQKWHDNLLKRSFLHKVYKKYHENNIRIMAFSRGKKIETAFCSTFQLVFDDKCSKLVPFW